ncbi:MAG: glycosyltransferase [Actinobacteria bacterium]|nr:glycosyltransferase [Actinomycetota bacterium]
MSSGDAAWPRISVVTPSFNQARFLRETMESIHSQGYPNLEHIVIDGGSTDESTAILAEYDSRLAFWVSEKDKGQTDAIARGFDRATGDVFCWLNSDDVFVPGALKAVGTIFRGSAEVDFLYGDAVWIDEAGGFIKHKKEQAFNRFVICFDHNFIPQPSTFWKADLYRISGGVDRSFNLAMDADLWLRMAEISKPKHISQAFSMMRFYGEQKNTRLREQSLIEMQRLRDRYYPRARGVKARRLGARIARVLGKTASRGYSMREVVDSGIFGGKDWEERQLDR